MSERKAKQPDQSGPAVPAWMVTFSDCMTLLLCFFVVLVTFSSFDEVELDKLGGAFPGLSYEAVFPNKRTIKDALIPPKETQVDFTPEGSEKPTGEVPKEIENPKAPGKALGAEAYRDLKVVSIPSARLFYARGSSLRPEGKELLKLIAGFVRSLPCKVIIGETGNVSLERPWAVVQHLMRTEKLPAEQLSISAGTAPSAQSAPGRPQTTITLVAGSFHR